MSTTTETILKAAQECFFQYGYAAANVSLIARYAQLSRATIYKNFCSKEVIFRHVVQNHIDQHDAELATYLCSTKEFWQETENLLLERCRGIFDDISSSIIRSELIHAGQLHCHDILLATKSLLQKAIEKRLLSEINQGNISIDKINISVADFAQVIEAVPMGIAFSNMEQNSAQLIANIFAIFKVGATK